MNIKKLLAIALFLTPFASFAQSIEKGAIVGELGVGISLLKTTAYDKKLNVTNEDTAGAAMYSLNIDYSIMDRVSVGGGLRYDSYLNNDSNPDRAHAIDIMVRPAFHLIKSKHTNIYAGLLGGVSFFKYQTNQVGDAEATGTGSLFGFNVTTRFFFTKSIGMYLSYTYDSFHYPNMAITSSVTDPYYIDYKLKGSLFGIGLNVRFQ